MRAIMVMFDTLTKKYLSSYGQTTCLTPNFKRLQDKCTVMDNFYIGSFPCMPARRELHTGKYNFLHRSWGPLEPFDNSVFEILSKNKVYTHLCTDHSHYFEDGGATYHNRYTTWEGFRGQEGDRWIPRDGYSVPEESPLNKKTEHSISVLQHQANKAYQVKEEDFSSYKTFQAGLKFIKDHKDRDNWFLQIESFDPHEPFYVPEKYRKLYDLPDKQYFYWPAYMDINEKMHENELKEVRNEYSALITMCDGYLGKVLDYMDEFDMWKDTLLIVNTDHGFLLGEHDFMGKSYCPLYQDISHIPFFIHIPDQKPSRSDTLCQTIDIAPTLLDYFNLPIPEGMEGVSLIDVVKENKPIHDYGMFGIHGGMVNITDGDYVFMKDTENKENKPIVECTLMPTHMRGFFEKEYFENIQVIKGNKFSNNIDHLKLEQRNKTTHRIYGDMLWDVRNKEQLIDDKDIKEKLKKAMIAYMKRIDTPEEQYERLGLKK